MPKQKQPDNQYSLSFIIAVIFHVAIVATLFIKFSPTLYRTVVTKKTNIVKAVAVDQKQVQAEMNKIKAQQQARLKQQRQLRKQALLAKKQRQAEELRLKKLRKKAKQAEQDRIAKQKAAEKKLAELKQKQKLEQQRIEKLNQQVKQKQEAAKKVAAEKTKKLAEQQRLRDLAKQIKTKVEQQKQAQAEQIIQLKGKVDKYKALVLNAIARRWIIPNDIDKKLSCKLLIRLSPNGTVLDVKLTKSSGNAVLDRSALSAVYKASPLPVPTEPDVFAQFRVLNLTVRPESVLSGA